MRIKAQMIHRHKERDEASPHSARSVRSRVMRCMRINQDGVDARSSKLNSILVIRMYDLVNFINAVVSQRSVVHKFLGNYEINTKR